MTDPGLLALRDSIARRGSWAVLCSQMDAEVPTRYYSACSDCDDRMRRVSKGSGVAMGRYRVGCCYSGEGCLFFFGIN